MLTKEEIKNFEMDPLIILCYDYILPISSNRVIATHGENMSLITRDGEYICTFDMIDIPKFDSEDTIEDDLGVEHSIPAYVDDYLRITQDGSYGLIDYDGNILVDPVHSSIRFVSQSEVIIDE